MSLRRTNFQKGRRRQKCLPASVRRVYDTVLRPGRHVVRACIRAARRRRRGRVRRRALCGRQEDGRRQSDDVRQGVGEGLCLRRTALSITRYFMFIDFRADHVGVCVDIQFRVPHAIDAIMSA